MLDSLRFGRLLLRHRAMRRGRLARELSSLRDENAAVISAPLRRRRRRRRARLLGRGGVKLR